jgi:hypothetical protein
MTALRAMPIWARVGMAPWGLGLFCAGAFRMGRSFKKTKEALGAPLYVLLFMF